MLFEDFNQNEQNQNANDGGAESDSGPTSAKLTCTGTSPAPAEFKRKFIISCDPGADDCMALFPMIRSHLLGRIDILAVVSSHGNSNLETTTTNLNLLMSWMKATTIPIYRGCEKAICKTFKESVDYFGSNGLNDEILVDEDNDPIPYLVAQEHGVTAITTLIMSNPGQITYLELAPFTSLATSIILEPKVAENLKEVYFLGCTRTGKGSVSVCADFNVLSDVEAVQKVLQTVMCPIYIFPSELRREYGTVPRSFRKELSRIGSKQVKMMDQVEKKYLEDETKTTYKSNDSIASCAALNPKIMTEKLSYHVDVEEADCKSRGNTLIDVHGHWGKRINATIVTKIDTTMYMKKMIFGCGGEDYV